MKSLKGTKTEKNILAAFTGESQARNKYTFFASAAKNEGFQQIYAAFMETAEQEKEHAKRLFKFLEGGEVEITGVFHAGTIGTTAENLAAAAGGEDYEWQTMYPEFAKTAREEGFPAVAAVMENIAVAEKQHSKRYKGLKANIDKGTVFQAEKAVVWQCMNCGYIVESVAAPTACPACAHPQAYFQRLAENW